MKKQRINKKPTLTHFKILYLMLLVLIMTTLSSCARDVNGGDVQPSITESPFVTVYRDYIKYEIIYDKDTMVMYVASVGRAGESESIEVLLNADGTPKLWKNKE